MSDPTSVQKLIQDVEQADSPERLMMAVQALASARSETGMPMLIRALGFNNPGAAAVAVQGLIKMGAVAVQPLLDLLDDYNYGARAWAIRALVAIADPRALDVLLTAAAADFAPSVRRAATKGLGTLQWHLLPDHDSIAAQGRVLQTLLAIAADSDWSLRYAATVGLESLGKAAHPNLLTQILTRLQQMVETESDLAVQARVRRAITVLMNPSIASEPRSISLSTVTH
ncbi:HEAT repeat domain-containing protein [Egbenema bharatensis]|uniref:HEAT repeat domain-containing protein n=1 Tax=Egbenema bharatensis TaxID=3463334 RepID=UPI003A878FCB